MSRTSPEERIVELEARVKALQIADNDLRLLVAAYERLFEFRNYRRV